MAAIRGSVVSITAAVAALLCWAPAAGAAERFASPEGTGEACTTPAPCDIVTAVKKAAASDDVTIEPGTYNPTEGLFDEAPTLTIHGVAGAPRPVIVAKNGGFILAGSGSSLRDVEVDLPTASQTALLAVGFGETVERVLMHAFGSEDVACAGGAPITITDSVCVADGTKSTAFLFQVSNTVQATLRNDTLEAPGGSGSVGSVGVKTKAFLGHEVQVTLINTIAHGSKVDLLASADTNPSSNGVIVAEHSNYATDGAEPESGGKASVTTHGTGTNQTAAPLIANPAMDDFHELAGSPTIGAGFGSPANGVSDLDGIPRQFGGATDIGAYQFIPGPTCQALTATTAFGAAAALQLQCADALGAPLTGYAIAAGPAHGSVALNAVTGAVTYAPAAGYSGPDSFTFDATSSHGTGAPATAAITVAPPPTPPASAAATPPSDSQPVLSPKTFAPLTHGASIAKAAHGTTVTYTDTQAATTTFSVRRVAGTGVLVHGRCVAPPRGRSVHGKRCTRFSTLGSFSHSDAAGANRFRFTGRVRGHPLKPGSYQLVSAPTNTAGKTGAAHTSAFRIVSG